MGTLRHPLQHWAGGVLLVWTSAQRVAVVLGNVWIQSDTAIAPIRLRRGATQIGRQRTQHCEKCQARLHDHVNLSLYKFRGGI